MCDQYNVETCKTCTYVLVRQQQHRNAYHVRTNTFFAKLQYDEKRQHMRYNIKHQSACSMLRRHKWDTHFENHLN
ncbi:unnamed protein product [Bursaphelenchus okinawaensis]|uniref:Uncharacterized protein n=1 Tax=Bursaphelenchus okinawaensis TaxID=465554 RepID=A0A811K0X7_9BILA|nr:unnamed protein product [Bursaphelenchus okinawaensis]CAG9088189.1 unnamed protein product [Bursaphelenchus okinawaensis]